MSVGIALFGLGRAGGIHFRNLLANRRVKLLWVVDQNEQHVKSELEKHGATETKFANLEQVETVLADPRYCFYGSVMTLKIRFSMTEICDLLLGYHITDHHSARFIIQYE